jgi:hypothetical protein
MANEKLPEQPEPEPEQPETAPTPQTEEQPPKVIEIKPPPPIEEALDPFVDMFMEIRGLKDKKQAAVKLANVLYHLGFNPQREIDNVTTYINNMSAILQSIPDTPETAPVKGAILARTAAEASVGLRRAHMPFASEEEELEKEARFYRRMAMSMRMMDSIFKGGETTSNPEVATLKEQVKRLTEKIEKTEEEKALDAKLAPIREQMNAIMHRLDMLATSAAKPKTEEESALSKEVKQMLDAMNKRLDTLDQRYQTSQEIQNIRSEIATLKTTLEKGGKPSDVTDVFDQAVKLIDKVNEVVKKAGGVGEGEFDWRAAALSSVSEIATEAIGAYKEIATTKPAEAEQPKTKQKQPEKVSEQIIDRKLLTYIQGKLAQGAKELNSAEAAQALGVSEDQVLSSFQRLKAKGILRSVGGESGGTKQETESAEPEWVEG